MPGRGRPFQPGDRANPRGRPRGVKETAPRGFVKKLALDALEGGEKRVRAALERAATNPRSVVAVLDLAAKLNREVGHQTSGETHFHIHTNLNLMALKTAAHRAVQPAPTALRETESET